MNQKNNKEVTIWRHVVIVKYHHWVLPNIWRLGWVRDTRFGTNLSNEMLLNAAKCQGYSFYRFWVIRENQQMEGGRGKITPPTKIRANEMLRFRKLKKISRKHIKWSENTFLLQAFCSDLRRNFAIFPCFIRVDYNIKQTAAIYHDSVETDTTFKGIVEIRKADNFLIFQRKLNSKVCLAYDK